MNNEPVAWMCQDNVADEWEFSSMKHCHKCEPLYTHPVKELTDEEIWKCHDETDSDNWVIDFARAILLKAQEK